jgi:hypothetical protein
MVNGYSDYRKEYEKGVLSLAVSVLVAKSVSGLEVSHETSVPELTFKQSLNMLLTHLVSDCNA